MTDPRAAQTLEGFVKGMIKIADIVQREDPSTLFIPIRGAVPLLDALSIVDPTILSKEHEYLPASSSITDMKQVLYGWLRNYFNETHVAGERQEILSIDEVVSGNSAVRVWKQVKRALADHARDRNLDPEEFSYKTVGLEDQRYARAGKVHGSQYQQMKEEGRVIPVSVPMIVTMDRPELCPVKLVTIPTEHVANRLPVMAEFAMSPQYLELLENLCSIVGRNFADVEFQRVGMIRASERFVPKRYFSLENYLAKPNA